ncbi:MAG: GNAT family N-acetyltransferase [Clostridium sp.]|nr:GNAT family N-acetyltransferase [Clostridium sp.]
MATAIKIYAETDRLVLRQWKPEDLPAFAAMNGNPDVMKYFPEVLTEAETLAFYDRIQTEFELKGWGLYAVELKSTGAFIGYVGLHEIGFDADFTPGVEIGWRLDADYHNQGYATEAALKVLDIARTIGIEKVYSFTVVVNKPSERVMQKIGMEKTGEFDHPKLSPDSPLLRHVLYQIRFSS